MTKQNQFINAEITVKNREEAELAAKKAEELGYRWVQGLEYSVGDNCLRLYDDGEYVFHSLKISVSNRPIIPLSDFLSNPKYDMCKPQPVQLDCRINTCKFYKGAGVCSHHAPEITLSLYANGKEGFMCGSREEGDHLTQPKNESRKEIVEIDGIKWRVELIKKVEEPMSAEEFFYSQEGVGNAPQWMDRYAKYRLEFERVKQQQ